MNSTVLCANCDGRLFLREFELVCITCGKIQYQKRQTISEIKRPKLLNDWVTIDELGNFNVYYLVKNRSLISNATEKGEMARQPYASFVGIIGPNRTFKSNRSIQLLCKSFYRATGLKLRDMQLPVISSEKLLAYTG